MTKNLLVKAAVIFMTIAVLTTTTIFVFAQEQPKPIPVEESTIIEEEPIQQEPIIIYVEEPESKPEPAPVIQNFYTTSDVNARLLPDINSESYKILPIGSNIPVISIDEGWAKIRLDGAVYYVWAEYLMSEDEWNEIPFSDEVPLDKNVQAYLYKKCKEAGIDYTFFLATIQLESCFNPKAHSKTNDYGLCQVNRCWVNDFKEMGWIGCADDLYNVYTNIDCGLYVMKDATDEYGVCERAYAFYNTGNPNVKSNKNSRAVMRYWAGWKEILGDI